MRPQGVALGYDLSALQASRRAGLRFLRCVGLSLRDKQQIQIVVAALYERRKSRRIKDGGHRPPLQKYHYRKGHSFDFWF